MYFLANKGIAMIAKFKCRLCTVFILHAVFITSNPHEPPQKTFHCLNKSDSKIEETFDYRSEAKYLPVNGLYNYSVLNQ